MYIDINIKKTSKNILWIDEAIAGQVDLGDVPL